MRFVWIIVLSVPSFALSAQASVVPGTYQGRLSCGPHLQTNLPSWNTPLELKVSGSQIFWRRAGTDSRGGVSSYLETATGTLVSDNAEIRGRGQYEEGSSLKGEWNLRGNLKLTGNSLSGSVVQLSGDNKVTRECTATFTVQTPTTSSKIVSGQSRALPEPEPSSNQLTPRVPVPAPQLQESQARVRADTAAAARSSAASIGEQSSASGQAGAQRTGAESEKALTERYLKVTSALVTALRKWRPEQKDGLCQGSRVVVERALHNSAKQIDDAVERKARFGVDPSPVLSMHIQILENYQNSIASSCVAKDTAPTPAPSTTSTKGQIRLYKFYDVPRYNAYIGDSLTRDGEALSFLVIFDYKTSQSAAKGSDTALSSIYQYSVRCRDRSVRDDGGLYRTLQMGYGDSLSKIAAVPEWEPVRTASPAGEMTKIICDMSGEKRSSLFERSQKSISISTIGTGR